MLSQVENIGAHLNAYTARDHTVYHGSLGGSIGCHVMLQSQRDVGGCFTTAKCLSKDVNQITELLSDIFLNSKFDAKKVCVCSQSSRV